MLLGVTAAITMALVFEHIGGFAPCELCLLQRWAYYSAIPLAVSALVLVRAQSGRLAGTLFLLIAFAFLGNAALAAYHSGVEWGFWPGPTSCTGGQHLTTAAGNLLETLATTRIVRCDEPAIRILGLSFAGWNVIASLLLAMGAWWTMKSAFAMPAKG